MDCLAFLAAVWTPAGRARTAGCAARARAAGGRRKGGWEVGGGRAERGDVLSLESCPKLSSACHCRHQAMASRERSRSRDTPPHLRPLLRPPRPAPPPVGPTFDQLLRNVRVAQANVAPTPRGARRHVCASDKACAVLAGKGRYRENLH